MRHQVGEKKKQKRTFGNGGGVGFSGGFTGCDFFFAATSAAATIAGRPNRTTSRRAIGMRHGRNGLHGTVLGIRPIPCVICTLLFIFNTNFNFQTIDIYTYFSSPADGPTQPHSLTAPLPALHSDRRASSTTPASPAPAVQTSLALHTHSPHAQPTPPPVSSSHPSTTPLLFLYPV